MKLGVFTRKHDAYSLLGCRDNIVRKLTSLGVKVIHFTQADSIPDDCDLVWEPSLAGNRAPHPIFKGCDRPLVATVHGAAPFSMKWKEFFSGLFKALKGRKTNRTTLSEWTWFREKVSAVITVSTFAAQEITHVFALPQNRIYPIYHGVDHRVFKENGTKLINEKAYFLHVSQYQPKKNLKRVFASYAKLPENSRPDLVAVLPNYNRYHKKVPNIKGLNLILDGLSPKELAKFYRGALGFIFPSLHESFGLPILEAMSCGCPVITSNVSACSEIAGDTALLVNPRSIGDIAQAMSQLINNESLRLLLRQKGLARAQQFTWRNSAQRHFEVFTKVLAERKCGA